MSAWDEMRKVIVTAKKYATATDSISDDMAGLLEGRLRKVSTYKLKRLKKELQEFNANTGKWKS